MPRTGARPPIVKEPPQPRPRPIPAYELPESPSHEVPDPPSWLTKDGVKAWRKLYRTPESAVYTSGDQFLAAAFCAMVADLPYETVGGNFYRTLMAIADRLLLSPRARYAAGAAFERKSAEAEAAVVPTPEAPSSSRFLTIAEAM